MDWTKFSVCFLLTIAPPALLAQEQKAVDVAVASDSACALYKSGEVYCWGDLPVYEADSLPFEAWKVEGIPPADSISIGRFGACAISAKGDLWCWGLDLQTTVRQKATELPSKPFKVAGLPPVKEVDFGYVHQCALGRDDGGLWCWGYNPEGELGTGDKESRADPEQVNLPRPVETFSTGTNNTCAILTYGEAACWGTDMPGGGGGIERSIVIGSLVPVFLDIKDVGLFTQIANGRNFMCAIRKPKRTLFGTRRGITCWGSNIFRQLGTDHPKLPTPVGGIGDVDRIKGASDIDATYFQVCAVEKGEVLCWGHHDSFVAGEGKAPWKQASLTNATRVGIGENYACAVENGKVLCWGSRLKDGGDLIEGMDDQTAVPVPGLP